MKTVDESSSKSKTILFYLFLAVVVLLLLGMWRIGTADAKSRGTAKACTGTYLVDFSNGSKGLWTFSADGTYQGTDSAQDDVGPGGEDNGFSHHQGAWTAIDKDVTKLVSLDFGNDSEAEATFMFRIDATQTFSDECAAVSTAYDLRGYNVQSGQDPLDADDGFPVFSDAATGRRISAE